MASQKRLNISINEKHAAKIRELVESGNFNSVSAAFDEAAAMLIDGSTKQQGTQP